jgi:uncharacterized SAM-binding protein YcdF (DUF218 family)
LLIRTLSTDPHNSDHWTGHVFCSVENFGLFFRTIEPHLGLWRIGPRPDFLKTLAHGRMAACLLRRGASDMRLFADRFSRWDPHTGDPAGIIVLGGGVDPEMTTARGTPAINSSGARIVVAAELAHRYPKARLVYVGGNSSLRSANSSEADVAEGIFKNLGIREDRLQLERKSRNTDENVRFSMQLVNPQPGERWLLVTSASHVPRAMGLFRKAGFTVDPYPVDWRTSGWSDVYTFQSDWMTGIGLTDTAAHEWLGLIAYRLTGRIDELLPSPKSTNPDAIAH